MHNIQPIVSPLKSCTKIGKTMKVRHTVSSPGQLKVFFYTHFLIPSLWMVEAYRSFDILLR